MSAQAIHRPQRLPNCLVGAGALGHTWVVTCAGEHGERISAQCNTAEQAVKYFDELGAAAIGIYHTHYTRSRVVWKRVTRAAAVIA